MKIQISSSDNKIRKDQNSGSCNSPSDRNKTNLTIEPQTSERKRHMRRAAHEIDRSFMCPYDGCKK